MRTPDGGDSFEINTYNSYAYYYVGESSSYKCRRPNDARIHFTPKTMRVCIKCRHTVTKFIRCSAHNVEMELNQSCIDITHLVAPGFWLM